MTDLTLSDAVKLMHEGRLIDAEKILVALLKNDELKLTASLNLLIIYSINKSHESGYKLFNDFSESLELSEHHLIVILKFLMGNRDIRSVENILANIKEGSKTEKVFEIQKKLKELKTLINELYRLCQSKQWPLAHELLTYNELYSTRNYELNLMSSAIYRGIGELEYAKKCIETCYVLAPDRYSTVKNYVIILLDMGEYLKAVELLTEFQKHNDEISDDFYFLLGNSYLYLGEIENANLQFKRAIKVNPTNVDALVNSAMTDRQLGNNNAAYHTYLSALRLDQNNKIAKINLANMLSQEGHLQKAIDLYQDVLVLDPNNDECRFNLIDTYEKHNQLDQMYEELQKAIKTAADKNTLKFYQLLYAYRKRKDDDFRQLSKNITASSLNPDRRKKFYELNCKASDRAGDYLSAVGFMNLMHQANPLTEKLLKEKHDYLKQIRSEIKMLRKIPIDGICQSDDEVKNTPVFLVGFPRSGTTLLDTALSTNLKIRVIEEKAMLDCALEALPKGSEQNKILLDSATIAVAQHAYFEELQKHCDTLDDTVIVDKLPLNLVKTHYIKQIFPRAKIILSIRHPLDCLTSNIMQNYRMNKAMACMCSVSDICELYDLGMTVFFEAIEKFKADFFLLKYEDLVTDYESTMTGLFNYLDIPFELDDLRNRENMLIGKRKNTPSYTQVIEPLYQNSIYRHLNYPGLVNEAGDLLKPWINKFGYGV